MFAKLIGTARYACGSNPVETKKCNTRKCPSWSIWKSWESCSHSCGHQGVKNRIRKCKFGNIGDIGCKEMDEGDLNLNITMQSQG